MTAEVLAAVTELDQDAAQVSRVHWAGSTIWGCSAAGHRQAENAAPRRTAASGGADVVDLAATARPGQARVRPDK